MSDNDFVVTQKEAADFLNVSTKSISRYRKRGLPYKLILNPQTGKQEVRFRYADLERWDEGRQLLATYGRDGEETAEPRAEGVRALAASGAGADFLNDLLIAYRDQIEILREQLEDMREQLARRDRQIDDLMRLMVGLQLEYKPLPDPAVPQPAAEPQPPIDMEPEDQATELFTAMVLPPSLEEVLQPARDFQAVAEPPKPDSPAKVFSREQLAASIRRLRQKGKSYEEIARGLNQIGVATLSGQAHWTVIEVQTLLPPLVAASAPLNGNGLP